MKDVLELLELASDIISMSQLKKGDMEDRGGVTPEQRYEEYKQEFYKQHEELLKKERV